MYTKEDGSNNKSTTAQATIIITGNDKAAMQKAKKAIQELASKGIATLLQTDKTFGEHYVTVHWRKLSDPADATFKPCRRYLIVVCNCGTVVSLVVLLFTIGETRKWGSELMWHDHVDERFVTRGSRDYEINLIFSLIDE